MKRFFAFLLSLALLLSMTACGGTQPEQTETPEATPATTVPAETLPSVTIPDVIVDNPISFFSLSYGEGADLYNCLNAYDDGLGMLYVERVNDVKKVGTFDPAILHAMTLALEESGLIALNGQSVWEEGDKFASMYIQLTDGTCYTCDFSGNIPQAFLDGFASMDAWFTELTASLPVYVPQPVVTGDVDPSLLSELMDIMNNSGLEALDSYAISGIPADETFAFSAGLSSADGISTGAVCSPMMMATAFSLVIVNVEDTSRIDAIRADFAANLDWAKWICVSASEALIAQKGNMVICLMGSDGLYAACAAAVNACGWTSAETLRNPNM